jgi:hypothetical protein
MSHKYKHIKKDYRKQQRKAFYDKVNFYKKIKHNRMLSKNIHPDTSTITEHIAFVIDGEVVEIIHCQAKMAAILLSNPEIIRIAKNIRPNLGDRYIDGAFVKIEEETE